MSYDEMKSMVIKIKQENPGLKPKAIYDIVSEHFETDRKQIYNILQHNKKFFTNGGLVPGGKSSIDFETANLPPVPVIEPDEQETMEIPIILYNTLHDEYLSNDQKIEILQIAFPE